MATFDEVIAGMKAAHAKGDIESARKLARIADDMRSGRMQPIAQAPAGPVGPQGEDLTTGPVNPPAFEDQAPARPQPNRFGDVTGDMMQGPWNAAKAYGAGVLDTSKSPTYQAMPENWNPALKAFYSKFGDAGMAALSTIGAGMAGAAGVVGEVVGGDQTQERRLASDLMAMSEVAVPELAGVSSVTLGTARAAPKVQAPATQLADDVAAAGKAKIPVMRTDVKPPRTFIGKVAQKTGEAIPVTGTAGPRAAQNQARIDAARNFVMDFGADVPVSAIDDVTASVLAKRSAELGKYTAHKADVISRLDNFGEVPTPRAIAAIDAQIAKLKAQKLESLNPVIAKLRDFRNGISGQTLAQIEENRKVIGKSFADPSLASIRDAGEKALSAIYGPLREDMGNFISANGQRRDRALWDVANKRLSTMAGELSDTAFKRVLSKGEATPEVVRSMLFSKKPSDVARLYKSLTPEGQARARTAIVQEALGKAGDLENLSPDKFKTALSKMSDQVGIFFKGEDFDAANGLVRALKLTERAAVAGAAPPTGIQNLPAIISGLVGSMTGSISGTVGVLGGIGAAARIYEKTGVQAALRAVAKASGQKAESAALRRLNAVLRQATSDAATVARTGAAQSAASANSDGAPLRAISQ